MFHYRTHTHIDMLLCAVCFVKVNYFIKDKIYIFSYMEIYMVDTGFWNCLIFCLFCFLDCILFFFHNFICQTLVFRFAPFLVWPSNVVQNAVRKMASDKNGYLKWLFCEPQPFILNTYLCDCNQRRRYDIETQNKCPHFNIMYLTRSCEHQWRSRTHTTVEFVIGENHPLDTSNCISSSYQNRLDSMLFTPENKRFILQLFDCKQIYTNELSVYIFANKHILNDNSDDKWTNGTLLSLLARLTYLDSCQLGAQ